MHDAAGALRFLLDDWLVDVATDFAGKCVLIALALTMLERVLLPERPAFFITAGQRGGGKTTAATMIVLGVTEKRPAAAAWSSAEEERRKALLAYLAEGLTALVWDNIPRGATISCASIEKALTAEAYSDRILGETGIATVPAFTVQAFTGNNIAPRGDMASRSLVARLTVDRPDPENRSFRHADPLGWTVANRGEILRALYTILLGNPQLRPEQSKECRTRFKRWWHLIGSAIEHAAAALAIEDKNIPDTSAKAVKIDFAGLFGVGEADDEQTTGLAGMLDILSRTWPGKEFVAGEVARMINEPSYGEGDVAALLRSHLEQVTGRPLPVVTAAAVGHRLKANIDAPTRVGDQTMTLRRFQRGAGTIAPGSASRSRVRRPDRSFRSLRSLEVKPRASGRCFREWDRKKHTAPDGLPTSKLLKLLKL